MAVAALGVALIAGASAAAAAYAAGLSTLAIIAIGLGSAALSYISSSQMMNIGQSGVSYPSTGSSNARSTSPSTGIPIVYGGTNRNNLDEAFIKAGSIVVWQNVYNGTSNQLCTVHAISIGEIGLTPGAGTEGGGVIKQIYIDNAPILVDGAFITAEGQLPTSMMLPKFRNYLQLEVRFGKPSYGGAMTLARQYGGRWTDEMRGDGLVQICTVIRKTNDSMIDGILTNMNYTLSVEMKGRLIYDLTDNIKKPSSNPPSQIYDFMTDTDFGFGLNPNDIDITSFRNMANYCKANHLYSNGTIQYDKSFKENLEAMLSTFGGVLYESNGVLYMTVDAPDIAVQHFDESNIVGSVNITTGTKSEYVNTMDSTYTNPENDYSEDIIRYPSDAINNSTVAADGYIIKKDLNYKWVQDKTQLATLSNIELLKSKYISNTITFNTFITDMKVFDVFTISFKEAGFVNNKYRVVSRTVPMTVDKTGIIQITAISYDDGIYQGKDPGKFPQNGLTNLPNPTYVAPPGNLRAQRLGATASGNAVLLTWDLSQDTSVRGYKIKYKRSDSTVWSKGGEVGKYTTEFEILNLVYGVQYDFAIEAYNTLGYSSEMVAIYNQMPQIIFALPKITNLDMVNDDMGLNQTYAQDFIFRWDDQSSAVVNGKTFADFFKYYEIRVYDRYRKYITSYYTTTNTWTYTFAMNTSDGLSRYRVFGIVAHGWGTGIFSEEVQIEVSNPQHPQLLGINLRSGFDSVFIDWTESNVPDYAGIIMQIAKDEGFSSGSKYFSSTNRYSTSFGIDDGSWYARVAAYDVFGQDELVWSPTIGFNQNTKVPYSKLNDDVVNNLLNSEVATGIVEKQIVDELGSRWQVQVSNNGNVTGIALAADEKDSVFTVMADRFSVISTDSAKQSDKVYPFVVQNGKTFINSAVIATAAINEAMINDLSVSRAKIQNAAIDSSKIAQLSVLNAHLQNGIIDSAKIAQQIQSSNWDGVNGWMINKNGSANFGNVNVRGNIQATSGTLDNVLINDNCIIRGTLSAARILGDQCRPQTSGVEPSPNIWGTTPVAGHLYTALRINGEDFDRMMNSNIKFVLGAWKWNRFQVFIGGDGLANRLLLDFDAGTGGKYAPYTYKVDNILIPAVGRGKMNYIYVMASDDRTGSCGISIGDSVNNRPDIMLYRAGENPVSNG